MPQNGTRVSARFPPLDLPPLAHDLDRAAVLPTQHVHVEARGADVEVADLERPEPRRQLRLTEDDALVARVDVQAERGLEEEKDAAGGPGLGTARDGVRNRRRVAAPSEAAEQLGQPRGAA